jgi:tetratricopeptide (TPR) repeat protein
LRNSKTCIVFFSLFFGLFLSLFLNIACSSTSSKIQSIIFDEPFVATAETPPLYKKGLEELYQNRYGRALEHFDAFLKSQPTSSYSQVANFNSGRALEGLQRWAEASERYRQVVQATHKAPRLQALALYQQSFPYEALGDDPKSVATLTDALDRAQHLPDRIASAELPARLASAYARVGNLEQAMKFYERAETGIARLKHQNGDAKAPEWLAKTLYLMGRVSLKEFSWDEFEESLRPIERAQFYLLQAVELDHPKWSDEAIRELQRVYDQIHMLLKNPPVAAESDDRILAEREAQKRQWDLVDLTLGSLRKLKAAKPPKEKVTSERIDNLYGYLATMEKRFTKILEQRPVGEGLTPEAKQRKDSVRGRVVTPDDQLEKQYKKPKPEPSATPGADPNL